MFEATSPARARNERSRLNHAHLLHASALQGLDAGALATLGDAARLIAAGDAAETGAGGNGAACLFLMVSGHAAVWSHGKVVELPGAGELFGEEQILGPASPTRVTLLGDATALAMPAATVLSALEYSPALARALLQNLSRRSLRVMERVESHAKHRALERVAAFIMRELPATDGPCDVKFPASKTLIASLLSMSKESLSRCLAQLAAEARITRHGRVVRVPVPWRLAMVCSRGRDCADCGGCRRAGGWLASGKAA